jgi:hypothetical protein
MRYRVLPYRQGSRSAKALADKLGGKVLKLEGSKYWPKPDDVVINWGNTTFNDDATWGSATPTVLNDMDLIRCASNKLIFFQRMKEEHPDIIPRFFTSQADIPDDAFPIVCRTVLAGHSGDGIVIADTRCRLVHAPLYVQYVKKQDEYRIHVGTRNDEIQIISVQRKARRLDTPTEQINWQVRNHCNGFVFVRHDVLPPNGVTDAAKASFGASGLDFGAVDVIWNKQQKRAYVLECNTAPGLEGTTVDDYSRFFKGEA